MDAKGYAALSKGAPLTEFSFQRREPGPRDVQIELMFCGICHSDLHMVDNDFGVSLYPMVPGHEMVGRVVRTGADVAKLRPGDMAAIGCFVDSRRTCPSCEEGLEQYCDAYATPSFSAYERGSSTRVQGGFSSGYVVDERFALKLPAGLDPARAAPLLCGGITTYSPLRHFGIGAGHRVGVFGLGGLGHLAVKFARAVGAHVVTFTTSPGKLEDAIRLGSHEVVLAADEAAVKAQAGSLDFNLDTIYADHGLDQELGLLRRDGTLCLLGIPNAPANFSAMGLVARRRRIAGSGVGGLPETQEMLDFCGLHGIAAEIELLPVDQVNTAFERLKRNDVKYRFVLDLQSLSVR